MTITTSQFKPQVLEYIDEAYARCGIEARTGYQLKVAIRSLNFLFSDWANRGLNLWTIDYATQTLTPGTNFYQVNQNVIDIVDATVTTTDGATANFEGNADTTDVSITKISRTEYMNLTKKKEESSGDARPTQYCLINGQVTTNGSSNSGRPEFPMTLFLYPSPDKAYIFKYFFLNRIQDAGAYTNEADVPFYFLPCLVSGLAYYISIKRAPQMSAGLKAVYDEECHCIVDGSCTIDRCDCGNCICKKED
jgi:hypothetical protein